MSPAQQTNEDEKKLGISETEIQGVKIILKLTGNASFLARPKCLVQFTARPS